MKLNVTKSIILNPYNIASHLFIIADSIAVSSHRHISCLMISERGFKPRQETFIPRYKVNHNKQVSLLATSPCYLVLEIQIKCYFYLLVNVILLVDVVWPEHCAVGSTLLFAPRYLSWLELKIIAGDSNIWYSSYNTTQWHDSAHHGPKQALDEPLEPALDSV